MLVPLRRLTGSGKRLIGIVVLALVGSSLSFFVFAGTPNPVTSRSLIDFELNVPLASANITGPDIEAGTAIGIYIKAVYEFLVRAAAILAVMMFSYGGLLWLTAAGEKGRVGEAQKVMTNALIGLVLALGSYTILYAINPKLKDPSNVNPRLIAAKQVFLTSPKGVCCYAETQVLGAGGTPIISKMKHSSELSLDKCKDETKPGLGSGSVPRTVDIAFYCSKEHVTSTITNEALCWKVPDVTDIDSSVNCTAKTPIIP